MMRVLATGDLHYNIRRSRGPTEALAERISRETAEVLLLLGDIGGRRLEVLAEALRLFGGFGGKKMLVAGNHDLWTAPRGDSLRRYEVEIAEVCREEGWHYLDACPAYVDEVAFVGNIGWYDHSYRLASLGVPVRFYQAKIAPGAAARLSEHRHLLDGMRDVPSRAMEITTRWMDGRHVRLPYGDEAFSEHLAEKLRRHLSEAADRARKIIVGMHHLPFAEMVVRTGNPAWDFATNYLGSEIFGEVLLAQPKVTHLLCAHNHRAREMHRGHLTCRSVGSTYTDKHVVAIELA
ncbi:MAG: metallophosphoesterase [Phycisphaerae bacterium]|nr:metallophosphoesterase [Phycisphaerae bacterium]